MQESQLDEFATCSRSRTINVDKDGSKSTASISTSSQRSKNIAGMQLASDSDTDSDDEFARVDLGSLHVALDTDVDTDSSATAAVAEPEPRNGSGSRSKHKMGNLDQEAVSLLSEIFPDASREELEDLHYSRIQSSTCSGQDEHEHGHEHEHEHELGDSDSCSARDNVKIGLEIEGGDDEHEHNDRNQSFVEGYIKKDNHDTTKGSVEMSDEHENKSHTNENGSQSNANISLAQSNLNKDEAISQEQNSTSAGNSIQNQKDDVLKRQDESSPDIFEPEEDGRGSGNGEDNWNTTGTSTNIDQQAPAQFDLPDDFLRIPQHQALKLPNPNTGQMEWKIVIELEEYVIQSHVAAAAAAHDVEFRRWLQSDQVILRTTVFSRDLYVGLGMQLREFRGFIYIGALLCPNGQRIVDAESYESALESGIPWEEFGPAFTAGVKPGDRVLGVNGVPFLRWNSQNMYSNGSTMNNGRNAVRALSSNEILAHAADIFRGIGDPIVLHILRDEFADEKALSEPYPSPHPPTRLTQNNNSDRDTGPPQKKGEGQDNVHPLIQHFAKKGLARSSKEKLKLSKELARYTKRASLWSANSYLRTTHFNYDKGFEGDERDRVVYPALAHGYVRESLDFGLVRQGICIHIVNTFVDRNMLVFTIWVFDVETRSEWYAPVRYFRDFEELRIATSSLNKAVDKLPFPASKWFRADDSAMSQSLKDTRIAQLEEFLRGLCNLVYTSELGSSTSEIALYVQTFLGCDNQLMNERKEYRGSELEKSRQQLRQAIQLYTYRLFLLPTFKTLITRFVDDVKHRATLIEERKTVTMNSAHTTAEKEKVTEEVVTVKHVFANILNLIMDGCQRDFDAIAGSSQFEILHPSMVGEKGIIYKEALYRDTVREQIEIEAYVPMRSVISRLLVQGWRYDDKIIAFKIEALKQKPQTFFKISTANQSPSGWISVIDILRDGVGRSTLPCTKLKSIVNGAKEIIRLSKEEHPCASGETALGADDFLPIFIYCVINADIERPCALCALLRNLCDDTQRIGEVGYYLSTFEATIVYIHELDLTDV